MPRNPTTFDEYQYGTSRTSRSSMSSDTNRSVHFDQDDESDGGVSPSASLMGDISQARHNSTVSNTSNLRRRRSSITVRLNALAHVGGVNSIDNFARSWTRAANFLEVTPRQPALILSSDDSGSFRTEEDAINYGRLDAEGSRVPRTSLLRAHLEASSAENAVEDDYYLPGSDPNTPRPLGHRDLEHKQLGYDPSLQSSIRESRSSVRGSNSIFNIQPHLATPQIGSYGTSYGTITSACLDRSPMAQAGKLWREQHDQGLNEREPLIVKEVEQDGHIVFAVAGQSTLPQTILNSTNVLIGVGLLSLPMGIKYAGWLFGMIFLFLSTITTTYTARLLAKCLDVDASLISFADVAYISFGNKARIATSVLFTLELMAACVALIVLFADTLDLLIPGFGVNGWKIMCGLILIPLNFAPLRLLSYSSFFGIFSCFVIVLLIFVDGFIKPEAPGSLREAAETHLFPANWLTLPLSFGLLMSPWGGHSVFPNIYRDMRHPHKFPRAIKSTFIFAYMLDCATAGAGYFMFGDLVMTEITANLIGTKGYPQSTGVIMSICIAIIPLTKVPLNARPIVSMLEGLAGLDSISISDAPALTGLPSYLRGFLRIGSRVFVVAVFVIISILFPAFDSIMAFMGSTLCFTICIILPLAFYLKIFGKEVSMREKILDWFLIVVCSILAVIGTIFAFLPKSLIGAE
ncbi:transmembrane amino acid transporter protein-domain-containing protein [Calycina marina]|uniref:Transmembrane amino acid transporter protein-domain-containing protein n=1 Tax=Calycina marina TaxID=1763456 RepID=A0A9P8CL30_9HELO|nr:transmembrane amino acid transporter protein-domain-containing protein [Calycina marina]